MSTLPLITSKLLPVPHGFSVREGGVSNGPYASLNLGGSTGDLPSNVAENLLLVARRAEVSPSRFFTVSQVHGDVVARAVTEPIAGGHGQVKSENVPPPFAEADAVWTDAPGSAVGVRTADCVPVLLCNEEGTRVMAVHSGWKGTALRIVARAVETLVAHGTPASSLRAAIGPCIRGCCYEVSEDVAGRFRQGFGPDVVRDSGASPHLDLAVAVRQTLLQSGVPEASVELLADCTACDSTRFFSHRRDRGVTGRHLSFIVRR